MERKRKFVYGLLTVLSMLSFIFYGVSASSKTSELKVIFLDVGQGDSILIEQGDKQILIDGGPDGQALLEKLGKYIPFWDRNIEIIMATHPDQDHIDGLTSVLKNYTVGKIIDSGVSTDSKTYANFKQALADNGAEELEAESGMDIKLGAAAMDVLWPDGNQDKVDPKDTNVASIVSKLTYGKFSFLFTGDFPLGSEPALLKSSLDPRAQILKVAHHGSKNATSAEFLETVKPEEAVISVGAKNRYGHPAPETLDRLKEKGIGILRTDVKGDIEYDCENNSCVYVEN